MRTGWPDGRNVSEAIRRSAIGGAVFLLCIAVFGCRSSDKYPDYSPHENLLSIAADFQLAASLDPYRDPPGEDLTGQSIARATLVRLANYQDMHPGRLTPEVLTFKARALERLGEYESAKRNYEEAAEYDTELQADCRRRAENLEQIIVARTPPPPDSDVEAVLRVFAAQGDEFRRLAAALEDPFYQSLALREAEDADVRRAELLARSRHLFPNGRDQAQRALEELLRDHSESRRALEHAMRLAHFHRELAEEEVRLNPPEQGRFSIEIFKRHYDEAADLLYRISQADGRPERLVARHELDALLAYGEQIQRRAR